MTFVADLFTCDVAGAWLVDISVAGANYVCRLPHLESSFYATLLLTVHLRDFSSTTIMADEDEDISILPGAHPAEIDLDDETQDFRFLDKLTYVA